MPKHKSVAEKIAIRKLTTKKDPGKIKIRGKKDVAARAKTVSKEARKTRAKQLAEDNPNPLFKKTEKQVAACKLMADHHHTLLYGGSRSGKTLMAVRQIFVRAMKTPSNHLIARWRYNHVKTSILHKTIPDVVEMCFPGLEIKINQQDGYIQVPVLQEHLSAQEDPYQQQLYSKIWLTGTDSKDRSEKILGNEYSTILLDEISEISWDTVTTLWTRLAEDVGLSRRMYYCCNPPSRRHWSYQFFVNGKTPRGEDIKQDTAYMQMNPTDNPHLAKDYINGILASLPHRQRERFLAGNWQEDVIGALWNDEDIFTARDLNVNDLNKIVVAVDPAVSNNPNSDETGIIVAARNSNRQFKVLEDATAKFSPQGWATKVLDLVDQYQANAIVAEVNQGGDMVKELIQNQPRGKNIKIECVRASKAKQVRAEPVQALYEQKRVAHNEGLRDLEEELVTWTPESRDSPNRLDALVWGIHYLAFLDSTSRVTISSI